MYTSPNRSPANSPGILDSSDPALYEVVTRGPGPRGQLPLTAEMLRHRPSGDAFGMTEDAGMGWEPVAIGRAAVRDAQHAGRHPRAGRLDRRPGLSHGPLRTRAGDYGGGGGV